jgi:hypothetical protein
MLKVNVCVPTDYVITLLLKPLCFIIYIISTEIIYRTYTYITNLVCYTYCHWFFNPECQHIFGMQTGYIFQSPKTIKPWTTKHYASLNQWYNTNNKCIFTKLNSVFILKTAAWTKNITTVNFVTNTWSIQQTPMSHGCTITNKQNVEPWKFSTSWGHTKVLFTCC